MMTMTLFLAAALAAVPADEAKLEAQLPDVFAKAAAHYRALDAAATPLMKAENKIGRPGGEYRYPHGWNKWRTGRDEYDLHTIYSWTSGHFAGSFWYLYEATGDDFLKARATAWTEILAPVANYTENHDTGFMMYCSYGNARRILKTERYDGLLLKTAESLGTRYHKGLGLIRSWGPVTSEKDFRVIPDNLMNLELLEFAAGKGRSHFDDMARSHADVTMKHHFRPDGGCYHVLDYDQKTGRVQGIQRGQGASCETAWSRGQSWGIYGYTMMYRITGYVTYLDFAKKLADYAINHPNMPADGIPYWDFGAPGEERDSSAGAIIASALLELSQYVGAADRDRYRAFAVKELLALASPAYFSEGNEIGHFLLKHGVGYKPHGAEIDTPLTYGDYYFLEALLRFRNLKAREREIAATPGVDALPAKAQLPADEAAYRLGSGSKGEAEKILSEPIPELSDEYYLEFWTNGTRVNYERQRGHLFRNFFTLVVVEAQEKKGRFLARIEDYVDAICSMKSWVLPTHDWGASGGKGAYYGYWPSTDLVAAGAGAQLACVVQLIGDRLRPATVARIKAEVERRVLGPVRREIPFYVFQTTAIEGVQRRCHSWIAGGSNWNAVCWDGVACAACGLVDDPADRAYFVVAADRGAEHYIEKGFTPDGYCSEGMGYWNYGFGHHLLMGRLFWELTDGKFNVFRRPKTRLVATYPRSYTLCPGISPAFADGNGAAGPEWLRLVDRYWPDLPKELPPVSEFPDGQVWLFRDPEGLSVAFKGGHNAELHNHNDLGSYYVVNGKTFVAGDPGGETYTRRTFSPQRYESKVLNSYGHPVPVVGGKLQSTGRKAAAKILEKKVKGEGEGEGEGEQRSVVTLDLTAAYDVKTLKTLTRTFVYDRAAKTFTVRDHAEFTEPTAFEDCYVTLEDAEAQSGAGKNGSRGDAEAQRKVAVKAVGAAGSESVGTKTSDETIVNPNHKSPHRFAWTFEKPVTVADVEFVYRH